jgi:RNA polymerase sigma-70 factor (ECF subfamily)
VTPALEEMYRDLRPYAFAIAYRMLGSVSEAEDVVSEAFLRLTQAGEEAIAAPKAYLATVTTRLAIDQLRSARARRESYLGPWLPEPLVTTSAEDDPLARLVRDEGVRMAAMVVLERLTPPQRVAFVLHDALSLPFEQIAEVLGCSVTTARQHASRARRAVAEADPPPRAALADQRRLLGAVADALSRGDTAALVSLLHPDAVLVNDSGGMAPAARRVVRGADKVARLLIGLRQRYGPGLVDGMTPLLVNGDAGYRTGGPAGAPDAVSVVSVADGRIAAFYTVLNPAKLTRLPGPGMPPRR